MPKYEVNGHIIEFDNEPSEQDIDEAASQFGPSQSENPLKSMFDKGMSNLSDPKTKPLSPINAGDVATNPVMNIPRLALSAAGVPEEDVLPAAGQMVGGSAGLLGAVGGATAGQGLRQVGKGVRGENVDWSALPKEAAITGAVEGVTRGTGNLIFRRQLGQKALSELGTKLAGMKSAMSSNPSLGVASEEVYMPLKQAMEEIAVPHGPQNTIINKWLRFMEKNPNLSAKNLIEMEKDLGEVAQFGEFKKGAFVAPTIKKPALNQAAKASRSQVSGIVDDLSEKAGQKGFKETSTKISKLLSKYHDIDVTKTGSGAGSRIAAGVGAGAATGNPIAGILTYLGLKTIQSPEARNLAFKTTQAPVAKGVGTGAKAGITEILRQLLKK